MASDLRLFLEDRPIQARRVHAVERLWRWSRRNPAVSSLAGSTVFLIMLVAGVASFGYLRTKHALQGEEEQRQMAEESAALALDALDRIFDRFSPSRMVASSGLSLEDGGNTTVDVPSPPAISKEAATLLEDMLVFYDRLSQQSSDELGLRRKSAEANRRVGDIRQRLGQYDEAVAAYRRAIGIYREIGDSQEGSSSHATDIARIQNELGNLYRSTSKLQEARKAHLEALANLTSNDSSSRELPEVQFERARTNYFLGTLSRQVSRPDTGPPEIDPPPRPPEGLGSDDGRMPEREPLGSRLHPPPPFPKSDYRDAYPEEGASQDSRFERPPHPPPGPGRGEDRPPNRPNRPNRPSPLHTGHPKRLVDVLEESGSSSLKPPPEDEEASAKIRSPEEDYFGRAISILQDLEGENPGEPAYRHLLALCFRDRLFENLPGNPEAAVKDLEYAISILEGLVGEFPDASDYQYDLSEAYAAIVSPGFTPTSVEGSVAEDRLRKAVDISERLVGQHPFIPQYLASRAQILHKLGSLQMRFHQVREAE